MITKQDIKEIIAEIAQLPKTEESYAIISPRIARRIFKAWSMIQRLNKSYSKTAARFR